MYLKYGNYQFELNASGLTTGQELQYNSAGFPFSVKRTFKVEGWITGDGQSELTQKENALKTALAKPFQDLIFYQDSGQRSSEVMLNKDSIYGVRITRGPDFNSYMGAEYVSLRSFSFEASGEFPNPNLGALFLLEFEETLSFAGGGSLFGHRPSINTLPQKQLIFLNTVYSCVQSGYAVGYRAYPTIPVSKFPFALKQSPSVAQVTPKRVGVNFQEYKVTWSYVHESASPLTATPTLWPI